MRRVVVLPALVLLVLLPLPAGAAGPTVQLGNGGSLGTILTDAAGKTLYMFKKDTAGSSTCYDTCAQNWPPLLIQSGSPSAPAGLGGKLGTTTRTDGTTQVTYEGQPLYYYAQDEDPGDTYGQGIGNVWFVVNPVVAASVLPVTGHAQSQTALGGDALVLLAGLALASLSGGLLLHRRARSAATRA